MSCPAASLVALLVGLSLFAGRAGAVVVERAVTPGSHWEADGRFSVDAARHEDGMIRFAITYRPPRAEYLVAHFELRDGETTLARTDSPGFTHGAAVTYHVAVPAPRLDGATFALSSNGIAEASGGPVALPGGVIYRIDLAAFGKDAREAKAG